MIILGTARRISASRRQKGFLGTRLKGFAAAIRPEPEPFSDSATGLVGFVRKFPDEDGRFR